jgi:hypothetical protein
MDLAVVPQWWLYCPLFAWYSSQARLGTCTSGCQASMMQWARYTIRTARQFSARENLFFEVCLRH